MRIGLAEAVPGAKPEGAALECDLLVQVFAALNTRLQTVFA